MNVIYFSSLSAKVFRQLGLAWELFLIWACKGQSDLVMLGQTKLNFGESSISISFFFFIMTHVVWIVGGCVVCARCGLLHTIYLRCSQQVCDHGLIIKTATPSLALLKHFMHIWVSRGRSIQVTFQSNPPRETNQSKVVRHRCLPPVAIQLRLLWVEDTLTCFLPLTLLVERKRGCLLATISLCEV